ncbi:DoxX family protein [Kutzneria sp. NPDC052558]|uniref:DoxX family protein n=1 Tax=Kutzneria sp. NPDC052558 TaxID=3364121 RepID=UPI0037C7672B
MIVVEWLASLLLAGLLVPSARGKLARDERQVLGMRAVGFPVDKLWLLAAAECAAVAGLVVGLFWWPVRVAAAVGLIGYFVGALAYLLRARVPKAEPFVSAGAFLLLTCFLCGLTFYVHLGTPS